MNYKFLLLAGLSAAFLNSCSQEDAAGSVDTPDTPKLITQSFQAISGINTRTSLTEDLKVNWAVGDMISINGKSSEALTEAGETATFKLLSVDSIPAPYYSFYPANMVTSYAIGKYTINFPTTQTFASETSFGKNANPAVAYSNEASLQFRNLCGLARVDVSGNFSGVKAVRFSSNEQNVAGTAEITVPTNTSTSAALKLDDLKNAIDGVKYLDVVFDGYQNLAVKTYTKPLSLYFAMPVGVYQGGWKITLLGEGGKVLDETSSDEGFTIERSKIHDLGTYEFLTTVDKVGVKNGNLVWAPGLVVRATVDGEMVFYFARDQRFKPIASGIGSGFAWNSLTTDKHSGGYNYDPAQDPCMQIEPKGTWKTPTNANYTTHLQNSKFVAGTYAGNKGIYFGTTVLPEEADRDKYVFLPCDDMTSWWTSERYSDTHSYIAELYPTGAFRATNRVLPLEVVKSIRCIKK